jgi:thiol-disulfide isomerase/thioredoxin
MKAEHLEFIQKTEYTIVYVGAEWCPPCKVLKPKIRELVAEKEGVGLLELDVDTEDVREHEEFSHIRGIPYVMIYRFGELLKGGNMNIEQINLVIDGKMDEFTKWLHSQIEGGNYEYDRRLYRNGSKGLELSQVSLKKITIPDNFWMYKADDTVGRSFKSFIDMQQRQIRSDINYYIDENGTLYFEDSHIKRKEVWDNIERELLKIDLEAGDELVIEHGDIIMPEKTVELKKRGRPAIKKAESTKIKKTKKTKSND